jgi:uncharacterized protein (DUF4415 family)
MSGASSRRGGQSHAKGVTSGKKSKAKSRTDWTRLRRLTPSQIRRGILSDPDVHPTDEKFWKDAKVVLPQRKEIITIRLDADLLEWFRQQQGYQTRINAILRAYMNANTGSRA